LAVATTIIGRRRRACLPQTLRRMMDRTMRTSTRLFAKALGLAIATTAALCITPNALSQDTGLLALPQEPPIEDPIDDLPGDPIPCSPDLIIVEPGEKVTILFEPPLQTAPSEVLVYETIIGQFIETTPSMITWIPTHCGWDYIQVRAVDEDGNSRVIVRLCFVAMIPQLTTDTPHAKSTHTPNAHNNKKTAVQVVRYTLRQHLTTRQTQPPTTHTIPKLALDHRNHRLHLPTLTIQATRLRAFHQLGTPHARPRPQPTPAPYRL